MDTQNESRPLAAADEPVSPLMQASVLNMGLAGAFFGLFFVSGNRLVGLFGGALLGALVGYVTATVLPGIPGRVERMAVSAGIGAATGLVAGLVLRDSLLPALRISPMLGWTIALALAGAIPAWIRRTDPLSAALGGGAAGWMIGAIGWPALGTGTRAEAIMVLGVLSGLVAGYLARRPMVEPVQTLKPFLLFFAGIVAFGALRLMNTYGTDDNLTQLVTTLVNVVVAVGLMAALWIGLNLIFSQAEQNFSRFSALVGFLLGALLLAVIDGNRALQTVGPRERVADLFDRLVSAQVWIVVALLLGALFAFVGRAIDRYDGSQNRAMPVLGAVGLVMGAYYGRNYVDDLPGDLIINLIWWPVIAGALCAGIGYALSLTDDPVRRIAIGVGSCVGIGVILGFTLKTSRLPAMKVMPLLLWPIALATLGYAASSARSSFGSAQGKPIRSALWMGLLGWVIGSFGVPTLGTGTRAEGVMAFAIAGALVGVLVGWTKLADGVARSRIDQRSRGWIFIGPALMFISTALVIPTVITFVLSFRSNERSDRAVGFDNYRDVLGEPKNLDLSGWSGIFTSQLTWIGLVLAVIAVGLAKYLGRQTGRTASFTQHSGGLLAFAVVLFSFAVFTNLRGTIINNFWWIFGVTTFATVFGLAIAVWADGAKGEKVAKSLIFLPMAISLVGASIIWRFMYAVRDESKEQTGVMNAFWVWLGDRTSGREKLGVGLFDWHFFDLPGPAVAVIVFLSMAGGLFTLGWKSFKADGLAGLVGFGLAALVPLWFVFRILFDGGIGGQPGDLRATVRFREDGPFNNWWLMIVVLWIQTGFAMVILSAGIKAVPGEYIEAAKIDGADDTQVFWRIIIPQIAPTIGVVVTTIMVAVTKLYDVVKVMTGGNFGTNVLANEMINQAFQFANPGTGSALAVLIFIFILPVMVSNVLRMQRQAAA